jgi:hypothetical protein
VEIQSAAVLFPWRCQYVLATVDGGSGVGEAGHDVNRDVDEDECGDLERESDGDEDQDMDISEAEPSLKSMRGTGPIAISPALCI